MRTPNRRHGRRTCGRRRPRASPAAARPEFDNEAASDERALAARGGQGQRPSRAVDPDREAAGASASARRPVRDRRRRGSTHAAVVPYAAIIYDARRPHVRLHDPAPR